MVEFVSWNIFGVLLLAGLIGAISLIPLNRSVLDTNTSVENNSKNLFTKSQLELISQIITYAVVISAALFGGFFVIERFGIQGAPILDMWLAGDVRQTHFSSFLIPGLAGFVMGAMLSPLSLYKAKETRIDFYEIALWKRLIAGVFHGGISEEILFRWGILSCLALLITFIVGGDSSPTTDGVFWAANLISALLFGTAHLPGSAAAAPLTPVMVILIVSLNILVGLVCGYFFWVKGIEAAIVTHIFFHIGMQPSSAFLRRVTNR